MAATGLSRVERMRLQLRAVALLGHLKEGQTYSRLSDLTGIAISVLNRYVKGRVVPSEGKARELIRVLDARFPLEDEVRELVRIGSDGSVDPASLLAETSLLTRLAGAVTDAYHPADVDAVLTVDSGALAAHVADRLAARQWVAHRVTGPGRPSAARHLVGSTGPVTLSLPRGMVQKEDAVLIVDPIVDDGTIHLALGELVQRTRGRVVGTFVPFAVGQNGAARVRDAADWPVHIVTEL